MVSKFLSGVVIAASLSTAADAATLTFATAVDWANNGTVGSANNRNVAANALGAPDGAFLSLGLTSAASTGFAVFDFGGRFTTQGVVVETTFGCVGPTPCSHHPERVEILAGDDYAFGGHDLLDLADFTSLGFLDNGDAQLSGGGAAFAIGGTFRYLALIDRSAQRGTTSTDGFDVDAVGVTLAPVPVPAALPLMAAGLAGLAIAGRRRRG